jgi:pimeloyl-ACP methyl ester carboxylesterase
VPALRQAGYHVLLFSYRDCGQSDRNGRGLTYGYGESEDVDSAVRFLRQVKGIQAIGVIGYSVGATSALRSAARNPHIGAIVAVAPFARPAEIWAANRPALLPPFVLAWMQRVVEWRKGISLAAMDLTKLIHQIAPRPILLLHGSHDERIPLSQVQELFIAAGRPKALWVMHGDTHDSIRTHGLETHLTKVIRFFDRAFGRARPDCQGA